MLAELQSCLSISYILSFDQQLILKNLLYKYALNDVRVTVVFIKRIVPNCLQFSCNCNDKATVFVFMFGLLYRNVILLQQLFIYVFY